MKRRIISYKARKKQRQARLYFLIVLLILIGLYKWGFSLFVKIISAPGAKELQTTSGVDIIPPQKPLLAAIAEATNSADLKISGYTGAGAQVYYYLNDEEVLSEKAGDDGSFSTLLALKKGINTIQVTAKNQAGNENSSDVSSIILDVEAPEINVDSPSDGQEFFGRQEETISVTGSISEEKASLTINDTFVRLKNGSFDYQLKLSEGENTIKLTARDQAGNESKKIIKVNYLR